MSSAHDADYTKSRDLSSAREFKDYTISSHLARVVLFNLFISFQAI